MFIFAHRVTGKFLGTSGLVTTVGKSGHEELSLVDEQAAMANAETNFGFAKEDMLAKRITDLAEARSISAKSPGEFKSMLSDGKLVGVEDDPAFIPPEPPLTPQQQVEAVIGAINGNLLSSEHDRRWLAQKEAAKSEGIPWLKANPAASQEEFEAAMTAALAAEFPDDPIVISPAGVIASYAKGAKDRALVAKADFEALRDLVVETPDKQIQKMLAVI